MPMIKDATAPNGASVQFHKITRVIITGDGDNNIVVSSWATEADYLEGKGPLWNWSKQGEPAAQFVADKQAALLLGGEFAGAGVVADNAETLAGAKSRRWAAIKLERTRQCSLPFESGGYVFDADYVNLTGAVLDAMVAISNGDGAAWTQNWVLTNNTVVTLTAAEVIAAGQAMKARISAAWATSQYLRGLIDAATTTEELAAVVWPQGD